ncbi:MAG: M50 family metallopeptidase [Patescibacteria group bacterium]
MDVVTFLLVFLFLSLIILFHEAGHFLVAKWNGVRVDEFGFGYPPRLFAGKIGETVYSVNALPFGGFVRIHGTDPARAGDAEGETGRDFNTKAVWRRSSILLAGVAMNILLGWFLLILVFAVGYPEHLIVGATASRSPAEVADIREGDVILGARYGNTALLDPIATEDFIALVKNAGDNELSLTLARGNNRRTISLHPRMNPPEGEGALGLALTRIGVPSTNLGGSIQNATETTWNILEVIAKGLYAFVTKLFVSPKIIESVAGPVGIFSIAAEAGAFGMIPLLQLMAILSLNIAVLNLLPFPALDGGRFLVVLIEKAIRRPIHQKIQNGINTVGFIVLVGLMILVTIKDVGKIVSGG